jgi:hypothetical protein
MRALEEKTCLIFCPRPLPQIIRTSAVIDFRFISRVRAGMMLKNQIFKLLFCHPYFNIKSLASPMTSVQREKMNQGNAEP